VNHDRVAAAAIIAIAATLFALTFGFEQMPEGIARGFGAEAFPRLVLATIALLALGVFVAFPDAVPRGRTPPMVYYTGASLLAFMALVPVFGMLGAMFVFIVGLGYLWGERRVWLLLLTAAAVMAAVWGIFVKGFAVQLPQSLFF
jgi:hypothetical protein